MHVLDRTFLVTAGLFSGSTAESASNQNTCRMFGLQTGATSRRRCQLNEGKVSQCRMWLPDMDSNHGSRLPTTGSLILVVFSNARFRYTDMHWLSFIFIAHCGTRSINYTPALNGVKLQFPCSIGPFINLTDSVTRASLTGCTPPTIRS